MSKFSNEDIDFVNMFNQIDNVCCSICGVELTIENVFLSKNNNIVIADEKLYCKNCSKKLHMCFYCNKIETDFNHLIHIENLNIDVCCRCYSSHGYYCCYKCEKHYSEDATNIQMHGLICPNCILDVDHFKCENCCGVFLADRYGADNLCITCANESVNNCLNYTYKPRPRFNYDRQFESDDERKLFMGIELECGYAKTPFDVIDFIENNANSFFYMKRDASIPAYGCEIVTHPATLLYHMIHANWKKLLKYAIDKNLNSDNDKCGIHIHMNRNYFTVEQIQLMDFMINNYKELWKKISRRESKYSYYVDKQLNDWGYQTTDRHCALNLSNDNTIELRIFKGTLDYNILMSYIQSAYSLAHFVKLNCTDVESLNHIFTKCNLQEDFINFCKKQNFENLNDYLKSIGF